MCLCGKFFFNILRMMDSSEVLYYIVFTKLKNWKSFFKRGNMMLSPGCCFIALEMTSNIRDGIFSLELNETNISMQKRQVTIATNKMKWLQRKFDTWKSTIKKDDLSGFPLFIKQMIMTIHLPKVFHSESLCYDWEELLVLLFIRRMTILSSY